MPSEKESSKKATLHKRTFRAHSSKPLSHPRSAIALVCCPFPVKNARITTNGAQTAKDHNGYNAVTKGGENYFTKAGEAQRFSHEKPPYASIGTKGAQP